MDYKDYFDWAQEYRSQAEILSRKLEERKAPQYFETSEQKKSFESATRMLYEMKLECIKTMNILERKAVEIKECEEHAENIVA